MLKRKPKHPYRRMNRTDPDAGWLNRANKPQGIYCLSHQTLDTDHGIVLDVAVTAAEDHCLLSATALNLKRMIKRMG